MSPCIRASLDQEDNINTAGRVGDTERRAGSGGEIWGGTPDIVL